MSTYRTLFIEAKPVTKERQKFLGEGTVTEPDAYRTDAEGLAIEIEQACNAADADGYEIISILPIDRGGQHMDSLSFSLTHGVILTARRKQ